MLPDRVSVDDFNDVPFATADPASESPWGTLEEVEMRPIRFLDKPLWQAGAFHLLVGEKGCGKGTYLAHLAAAFTRGEMGDKRMVVWIAAGEDSLSLDVKPRIVAAGGVPGSVVWPRERLLLPGCVDPLRQIALQLGDVGLILFDPLAGLFDSKRSSNYDSDIRATIDPLNHLSDELDCLTIGVRHLGKDRSRGALHSILGGLDWINVPRAVVGIGVDEKGTRHIQVMAGNRTAAGSAGRSFEIRGVRVGDFKEEVTKAVFTGGSTKDVNQLLEEPVKQRQEPRSVQAKELLMDVLDADGETESQALTARVAQETGLAAKTISNVATELKNAGLVRFRPVKDPESGRVERWMMSRSLAPRPARDVGGDVDTGAGANSSFQQDPEPHPVASKTPANDQFLPGTTNAFKDLPDKEGLLAIDVTQDDDLPF